MICFSASGLQLKKTVTSHALQKPTTIIKLRIERNFLASIQKVISRIPCLFITRNNSMCFQTLFFEKLCLQFGSFSASFKTNLTFLDTAFYACFMKCTIPMGFASKPLHCHNFELPRKIFPSIRPGVYLRMF